MGSCPRKVGRASASNLDLDVHPFGQVRRPDKVWDPAKSKAKSRISPHHMATNTPLFAFGNSVVRTLGPAGATAVPSFHQRLGFPPPVDRLMVCIASTSMSESSMLDASCFAGRFRTIRAVSPSVERSKGIRSRSPPFFAGLARDSPSSQGAACNMVTVRAVRWGPPA